MPRPIYNLSRFDFISIKLAVACLQTGSLTAAARQSNLVLAAASRRIRELEQAVGEPLFERHSRGLVPTQAGRLFARHGMNLLQELDDLMQSLADAQQGVLRHIRMVAGTAAINQFLPPLLAKYALLEPQVQVDIEEQVSEQVVLALREGRADVGVFVEGVQTHDLELRHFRHDELVLILPPGHALTGRSPIAFTDTLHESWISLNSGAAMLVQQQQAARAAGKPFKLRMQVRSFDAVGHMVASRLGIAMLPKLAAKPIIAALKLSSRPLSDGWAQREMLIGIAPRSDAHVLALRDFLCAPALGKPSQNAKATSSKRQ
jgi:DNA-binding transcriptional LysR family regulator